MTFTTRHAVGRSLAALVHHRGALVLGVPRGGAVVAAHLAVSIAAQLDVLVVRETSIGIYVEGCRPLLVLPRVVELGLHVGDVKRDIEHERAELQREADLFRGHRPFPAVAGRTVIVVDDGTISARALTAASQAVRARGARSVILALPFADAASLELLRRSADEVVSLAPAPDRGVAHAYHDDRVREADVIVELARAREAGRAA